MQGIVGQIHNILVKKRKTLAVAESCTGGLVSGLLTQISGSSLYFTLGLVTYSNKTKERILKIPGRVLSRQGAVSKEVAAMMSTAVRKLALADLGIGITGIAGPTGGTLKKPVGTVFIAVSSAHKKVCQRFHFKGNRNIVRKQAAFKALELLMALMSNDKNPSTK